MSTRANYYFENEGILLYIHCDGYPEGAQAYFNRAILSGDFSAFGLIRANPSAEHSSAIHGDIEYYYSIDTERERIRAYSVSLSDGKRSLFFDGSIYGFINKYYQCFSGDGYTNERDAVSDNYFIDGRSCALIRAEFNRARADYGVDSADYMARRLDELRTEYHNLRRKVEGRG